MMFEAWNAPSLPPHFRGFDGTQDKSLQRVGFSRQTWPGEAWPASWGPGFWGSGPRSSMIRPRVSSPASAESSGQSGFLQLLPFGGLQNVSGDCIHPIPPPLQHCPWWLSMTQPWPWEEEASCLKWTDPLNLRGSMEVRELWPLAL